MPCIPIESNFLRHFVKFRPIGPILGILIKRRSRHGLGEGMMFGRWLFGEVLFQEPLDWLYDPAHDSDQLQDI